MSRYALMQKPLALAALAALFGQAPVPVANAEELVLEEVIVTARRRAENLQETPVAVTALDADALRDAGIRNLADLNQIAPNIEVASANGSAPNANIFIRGVGQRNTGANIDSGVGIYIDEVYVGRPDGGLLDLNDVQSVQVLRGPQGTLFGKNTTGGALVFTTNPPVEEFEGSLGLRVGNYDRLDGEFVVNVPLSESLWTRLSGVAVTRDGYLDNRFDGREYMDEDRQSLIWKTRWEATDDLMLDFNLNWAKTQQRPRLQKCVLVPEFAGWQAQLFNTLGITPATGKTLDDFCAESAALGDATDVISDLPGHYEAENRGASLIAEWDISEDLTVKSKTAWRYTEASQDDDLDHTGTPFLHRTNLIHPFQHPAETDQYSQELQLTGSAFDDRMQFVAGLYWFQEQTEGRVNVNFLGPWDPAFLGGIYINATASELAADNDAVAAFAQVEWEFNARWRTTVGLRYTDENREYERIRYRVIPGSLDANGGVVTGLGGGLYLVERPGFEYNPNFEFDFSDFTRDEISDDDISPMASVQYLIEGNEYIDAGSVYLTYSEGFLSGGLSESPTDDLDAFLPEEVENWELGFKLDLLDKRLRVNGALYYSDYTNRQLTSLAINLASNSPAGATINAARTTVQGFELETTWLASRNLMLTFNMTLNNDDIEAFDDTRIAVAQAGSTPDQDCLRVNLFVQLIDVCPRDRSGENLPRLPQETYLLAAQYRWDTALGLIVPRLQASWKFDIEYCLDSASCESGRFFEDRQFDLNARVSWVSADEQWVGAVYGSNLTDEDYSVGGTALVESSGVGGFASAAPRMYGVELKYTF